MSMPCAVGNAAPGRPLKKAQREGRLIVFVDESGISERPTRVRTWAPKGQTPVIQFHFNWNHVSVIAGLTRTNCLFRLHEGSIKKEEVLAFLKALKAHLKQPLLVIWDGLKAHRSRLVRDYLDTLGGHIQIAFLPPYAPDLNPVEYLWAWLKRHALANYCPNDLGELHATARNKLKSAQKRPSIIAACWMQATPPRHNTCRLFRTKNPGGGDEGNQWLVMDRHSRTVRLPGCCRPRAPQRRLLQGKLA
jgi:transposase